MEKIDFRAWYKPEKIMCEVVEWKFMTPTSEYVLRDLEGFDINDFEPVDEKDIILRPFTGLYDKDGEKIYCGDILKNNEITDEDLTNPWTDTVIYHDGVFTTKEDGLKSGESLKEILSGWFGKEKHYYKIIGNIYENKELID